MNNRAEQEPVLKPYLSRLGAFSLVLGTSIGWGSLVVTNNEYLAIAGPAGSIAGMVIGALVMLLMARNFFYLVSTFRDAGGVYAYVKSVFGYDRAFLISWFLGITYIAMLWANATSGHLLFRAALHGVRVPGLLWRSAADAGSVSVLHGYHHEFQKAHAVAHDRDRGGVYGRYCLLLCGSIFSGKVCRRGKSHPCLFRTPECSGRF